MCITCNTAGAGYLGIVAVCSHHATWHGLMSHPNKNRLRGQGRVRQEAPKGATLVDPLDGEDIIPLPLPQGQPAGAQAHPWGKVWRGTGCRSENAGDTHGMIFLFSVNFKRYAQVPPSPNLQLWRMQVRVRSSTRRTALA